MALEHYIVPDLGDDPDYQGFYCGAFSPNGRYVLTNKYRALWTLDRTNESYTTAFMPGENTSYNSVAIDNDGTIYALSVALFVGDPAILNKIENFGNGASTILVEPGELATPRSLGLYIMPDASKVLVWADDGVDHSGSLRVYTIGGSLTTVASGISTNVQFRQTRQDSYGDVWAITSTAGKIIFQRIVSGGEGTAAPDYNEIVVPPPVQGITPEAYHSSAGWFVSYDGGTILYLLDDTDFSIIAQRSYAALGSPINSSLFESTSFLLGLAPGADEFWYPGPNSFDDSVYSDLHRINAADLTSLEILQAEDWLIDDIPDPGAGMVLSTHTRLALISQSRVTEPSDDPPPVADYTTVLRYFAAAGEDEEDTGTVDQDVTQRVWPFSLDGHDYAVFRLGPSETLVFDLTTKKWAEWQSPDRTNWRAHIGQNWIGMTESIGFGSDVVAGDDHYGVLWILDPTAGQDDHPISGDPVQYQRKVTGGLTVSGRDTTKCGAVTLSLSVGAPIDASATITLRTSDDFGHSWRDHGSQTLVAGQFGTVVEWRALGLIKAPGRIFEIIDNGAAVRVNAADMR